VQGTKWQLKGGGGVSYRGRYCVPNHAIINLLNGRNVVSSGTRLEEEIPAVWGDEITFCDGHAPKNVFWGILMPPWKVMKMNQFRRLLIEPQHPHLPLHQVCEGFGPFPVKIGWCSRQMRCGPSGVQYSPKISDIMATRGVQVTPETVRGPYCIVLTGLGAKLDQGGG